MIAKKKDQYKINISSFFLKRNIIDEKKKNYHKIIKSHVALSCIVFTALNWLIIHIHKVFVLTGGNISLTLKQFFRIETTENFQLMNK